MGHKHRAGTHRPRAVTHAGIPELSPAPGQLQGVGTGQTAPRVGNIKLSFRGAVRVQWPLRALLLPLGLGTSPAHIPTNRSRLPFHSTGGHTFRETRPSPLSASSSFPSDLRGLSPIAQCPGLRGDPACPAGLWKQRRSTRREVSINHATQRGADTGKEHDEGTTLQVPPCDDVVRNLTQNVSSYLPAHRGQNMSSF